MYNNSMKTIENILNASNRIDSIIITEGDVALKSSNILSLLRHLLDGIAVFYYQKFEDKSTTEYEYDQIEKGWNYLKSVINSETSFLVDFYYCLQESVSHYVLSLEDSYRLLFKYINYLYLTRKFVREQFNFKILNNLSLLNLNKEKDLFVFHKAIANELEKKHPINKPINKAERYCVLEKKPLFFEDKIYYELTISLALDVASKYDKLIVYTKHNINPNYSIVISTSLTNISIDNFIIPITIIEDYNVSIRPCEFINYGKILNLKLINIYNLNNDYYFINDYLKKSLLTLFDIVNFTEKRFNEFLQSLEQASKSRDIFNLIVASRKIIYYKKPGYITLSYLLLHLNNTIIKKQSIKNKSIFEENPNLSNLHLGNGVIPFEQMPYCTDPLGHISSFYDILKIENPNKRSHELLANYLVNVSTNKKNIFFKKEELSQYKDIDNLVLTYNSKLYKNKKHQSRKISKYKDFYYIDSYDTDTYLIIKNILELANSSPFGTFSFMLNKWIQSKNIIFDDNNKEIAMKKAFNNSTVFAIYGSAGTGKTYLLNYFADLFSKNKKVFLTNTYASLNNLKNRINTENSFFYSIRKFLCFNPSMQQTDILIIDECSTVSNEDMKNILKKCNFKLLILSGDPYQIEAIRFGNWFEYLKVFLNKNSLIELNTPQRTKEKNLIKLRKNYRENKNNIAELLSKYHFVSKINNLFSDAKFNDEIILCLTYSGLFGINNINKILQQSNNNRSVSIGLYTFKINDPVLFNENCEKYSRQLFNNLKGTIENIDETEELITFFIKIKEPLNPISTTSTPFFSIVEVGNDYSIVKISISKNMNTDKDDLDSFIPFNISYAISIHKAQGLEYESVKIVIVDEICDLITPNIFYTAITRAKNYLKIYWSEYTQEKVLSSTTFNGKNRSINLFKNKHSLKFAK